MNMNISRRKLLSGTVIAAGAIALAGCSATQIAQAEATWAQVAGTIQQAVATAASYVPTIESIAETAASLFGPGYAALVTAGSTLFNQVVQTLINVVTNLTPPASARLSARLRVSSPNIPVVIGVTSGGVQVNGFRVSA